MQLRQSRCSREQDLQDSPNSFDYTGAEDSIYLKKNEKQFSLTLLTPERGEIALPNRPVAKQKQQQIKGSSEAFKKKDIKSVEVKQQKMTLPSPKFSKLGPIIYCVYNANIISIFEYNKEARGKKKKLFQQKKALTLNSEIKFVKGNNKLLLIAFENQFTIMRLDGSRPLVDRFTKSANSIIGGCFQEQGEFVIVTRTSFTKYYMRDDDIITLSTYKMDLNLGRIKFIELLKDQQNGKYLLIIAQKRKVTYNSESKTSFASNAETRQLVKDGQALQIIQLGFTSAQENAIYQVSSIPQQGVFQLSKAFYLGQQSFLLSLFEQIIVVRKQFSKYIVVDNTAIASMNTSDDTKTGQLLLVDKQKVVYNDHEGINVYNLLFVPKQDKIKMQSVDNFSPIDQSQLRLYDGLLLQSGDTNLQILFYFDNRKIMRPGKKNNLSMEDDQKQQQKYKLKFSVYAIVQSQPIQRLIELLKLKRPQIEINEFRTHFNISPLEFYKSQWSVSQKSLNDIINNLLEISDEQFIESQLDTVLKKQSTTLNFLIKIEEKQVTRLKKVIISKLQTWQEQQQNAFIVSNKESLLKFKEQKTKNKQELIKIIKKLLESKMFLKKLRFQNEFQAYKIIDFIEINKLRQMSLREQIKLLSSKGYEKRLKQFLNQFKYLAIANFEGIFQFLMENKNEKQAQDFLFKMGFLFPLVVNYSSQNNGTQTQSTKYHHEQSDDSCYLWDNFETLIQRDKNQQKPETIESLVTDLFPDENLKSKYFRTLMQQFIQTDWFKVGAFKKHCQLSITYEQLVKQFNDLKSFKIYNIIYKYLFQKIQTPQFRENIIISLFNHERLPQTIRVNMRIRQKVYAFLVKYKLLHSDIKVSDFLILNQRDYFKYITIQSVPQNVPQHLLFQEIKNIYQQTIEQYLNQTNQINNDVDTTPHQLLQGFFQQCFSKSMQNTIVTSDQLKFYLNQFIQLGTEFQRANQDLLEIIIKTANKTFKICGNSDEILAIANLFFKIDLSDKNPEYCSVFLQIAFFNGFWKKFNLDYTFHDLCQQQFIGTVGSNKIILQAIEKYCKKRFVDPKTDPENDNNDDDLQKQIPQFQIFSLLKSSYEKLEHTTKKVNIRKPAQFFQFLILMTNQIGYSQKLTIPNLEYFLLQMLENEKYQDIRNLNVQLYTFIKDKNPDQFLQQLIIKHVRQKQQNSVRVSEIYDHVINSLNLIVPVTIRTKQQKAILQLCKHIQNLDYRILSKIPNIREMLSKPPLVFMMEIWLAGSVEVISSKDSLQVRLLMQSIYEKYKQATSFDINFKAKASFEIQFLQFEIQRGYQYIERKMLEDAVQICKLLSNQDKLYFGDLVYSLTCQIARNLQLQQQSKEAEALRLVKYSIQHNSMIQIVDNLEDVMRSKNAVEFNIQHALNLLTTFVQVVMLEERGDISHKDKVYYQLFFSLLPSKPIEAFYFLMKNKNLDLVKTIEQLQSNKTLKISKQAISKHLSLAIYIRSLGDVVKDFYPTYSFFQKKDMQLSSEKVKKDINYLAEKLNPNRISQYLLQYYDIYMRSLSLSGYIDLTQIKQDKLLDIDKEMNQYNKQYLRQKQQIQQSKRKYEQLMKTINAKPKPVAPLPTSQHSIFKPEKSQGSQQKIDLPSKRLQKYQQIKRRQMHDLKKVQKQFVRQQSTNNVDKILQMFKERKQQRLNNLRSEENSVRQRVEQIKNKPIKIPERQQVYQRTHLYPAEKANDPAFQIRQRMLQRPTKQRINQQLRKRNIVQKPQKPYTEHALSRNPSEKLNQSIISNLTEFHQQANNNISKVVKQQSIQYSLEQLKRYLQNHNEVEVLKYLQKFELIYENMTLGKEFIKRMFDLSKTFETWMKVIQFIIKNYESYAQIYEGKSLKLCSQSLKIAIKIDPKKLFNLPFFMFVTPGASEQKYNHQVFEHLKANLVKLLDDSNVQALAKAFFYGMGLIRKYQYMIYIYYLDAKLEQYLNTAFNSKQEQYLLQRLKSVYSKLGADMRQSSVKDLFRTKINTYGGDKLKILIRLLQQSIARSSKLRNVVPSADESNLLKLLKSI